MTHKKVLLLTLSLSAPLCANPLKDINNFIKNTIAAPLGDYAGITAVGLITTGSIYAVYKATSYRNRKIRFSHHEALQDHFEYMLDLQQTYTQPLAGLSQTELSALYNRATQDLTTLSESHNAVLELFKAIKDQKHLKPLYLQRDLFASHYEETHETLISYKLMIELQLKIGK